MKRIGCGLLLVLAGCVAGSGTDQTKNGPGPADAVTMKSGLRYQDLKVGNGETAQVGDFVLMQYTGWLADGTQFDSNVGRAPLGFKIGTPGIIDGWQEGVPGMKVGGKRKLIIPPDLAYGAKGFPKPDGSWAIPPNAALTFEVELVKIAPR